MRILYLSDVVPADINAGYVVMNRHLKKLKGHELKTVTALIPQAKGKVIPGDPVLILPRSRNYLRVANRIGKKSFWMEREAVRIKKIARPVIKEFRPELILTVMTSAFFLSAGDLSREFKIPLVVICHDDFEHLIDPVNQETDWASRRAGEIYRSAAGRLCVGPGMAQHLLHRYGGEIGEILYPIPSDKIKFQPQKKIVQGDSLKIGFFGELGGNYEPVNAVVDALSQTNAELHIFGHSKSPERKALSQRKNVKDFGFVPRDQFLKHFREVIDVILIPQGFDYTSRVLRQTCFPSKLSEATRFRLPLLIVAPPHGSAARWGREHLPPEFTVSELSTKSIRKSFQSLTDPHGWLKGKKAVEMAAKMFEPDLLQAQFESALRRALESCRATKKASY